MPGTRAVYGLSSTVYIAQQSDAHEHDQIADKRRVSARPRCAAPSTTNAMPSDRQRDADATFRARAFDAAQLADDRDERRRRRDDERGVAGARPRHADHEQD